MKFELVPEQYLQDDFEVLYAKVPWDSEYLHNSTYEIFDIKSRGNGFKESFRLFENYINYKKGDLLFAKLPVLRNDLIQSYAELGFYFVEQSVEPILELCKWFPPQINTNRIVLTKASKNDIPEIKAVAEETFTADRYHLDVNIPSMLASYRYGKWVENSFEQGETILVCRSLEQILGFFIIKTEGKKAQIRLNGIKLKEKGKGLGKLTYIKVLSALKKLGFEQVSSRVSFNNLPVVNIYSSLGFKFYNTLVVMHKYCK